MLADTAQSYGRLVLTVVPEKEPGGASLAAPGARCKTTCQTTTDHYFPFLPFFLYK